MQDKYDGVLYVYWRGQVVWERKSTV